MLYFQGWKLTLILGICLLGVIFALPNAFAPGRRSRSWPSFLRNQISLGLDLRGGSYLLLQVDMRCESRKSGSPAWLMKSARSCSPPRSAIPIWPRPQIMSASRMRDTARINDVKDIVNKIDPDMDVPDQPRGVGDGDTESTGAAIARRSAAASINRSRSCAAVSTRPAPKSSTIQREGDDRILVQLPGVDESRAREIPCWARPRR